MANDTASRARFTVLGLVVLLLAGTLGAPLFLRRERAESLAAPPEISASPAQANASSDSPSASAATREAAPPAPSEPAPPPLDDDELRAALRRLAKTDMQDSTALEGALRPLLVPTTRVFQVLEHLEAGGLADDASHLSLEEVGALRCLTLAVLVFNPPEGVTGKLQAEGVVLDGHTLLVTILRALPNVLEPAREILADMLGELRDERGRAILDASFADELERLAAAYPECAELFRKLLAGLLDAIEPDSADALRALYLGNDESPVLVAAGLARWLEQSPATALAWAVETFDDPDTKEEIRQAITGTLAKVAPVEDAAEFLGQRAKRTMLVEFLTVGEREGGLEALDQEYWNLRIAGDADPRARTMLVSGMTATSTEKLLSISQEDPSVDVRSQAWITLTFSDGFVANPAVLERLDEAWNMRSDPILGVTTSSLVMAAGNIANKTADAPALRAKALDLLRSILRDRSQPSGDRQRALEKLKAYVPAQEYLQLSKDL